MPSNGTGGTSSTGRSRPAEAPPADEESDVEVDEQALLLREADSSYASIARRLEMRRAADAHRAFVRAVRARGVEEQSHLVANEHARLTRLEARLRDRDGADPGKLDRGLRTVARLRASLA